MNYNVKNDIEQVCVIVNFGQGSKVLKIAKQNGVTGGTIFLGKGTVRNRILEFLELNEIRKEIVIMVCPKNVAYNAMEQISKDLKFDKPNKGIAYSISTGMVIGSKVQSDKTDIDTGGNQSVMYNAIYVVVDKGKGEQVMDAANKAGSTGGTIINARGAGIHETGKLFAMEIEPEKEVVLILSDEKTTENIVSSIREEMHIDEPGMGIIFVQEVKRTYGIRQGQSDGSNN